MLGVACVKTSVFTTPSARSSRWTDQEANPTRELARRSLVQRPLHNWAAAAAKFARSSPKLLAGLVRLASLRHADQRLTITSPMPAPFCPGVVESGRFSQLGALPVKKPIVRL